ncbi:uncharacterized protein LOC129608055 [Condylostylus longicornis]|uniref:uncharacterized protein LOC129608055 n=1 Tax=Condylostylus longicornis TaxID=2530218 RepID=UPI00244DFF3F|nr:uncharacterized protein LOC129608055 [Condylostylus longicornis]
MKKIFNNIIGNFFIILFCINTIYCKRGGKFHKHDEESNDVNSISSEAAANAVIDDIFNMKQYIKFGENNMVTVQESSEILHENGTVTTKLCLDNGISLNINAIPEIDNDIKIYTIAGTIEFSSPDFMLYYIEFNANSDNFTILQYERKIQIGLRANAKQLAALAG